MGRGAQVGVYTPPLSAPGHSGALNWDHPLLHTPWKLRPLGQCMEGQLGVRS